MHIDITPENLLTQLGYPTNDALLAQMKRALEATPGFDHFSRHLMSLKDEIARFEGYIALSNSRDLLKIKSDASRPEEIAAYKETLKKWADKYKVTLEPVNGTHTFYLLGLS